MRVLFNMLLTVTVTKANGYTSGDHKYIDVEKTKDLPCGAATSQETFVCAIGTFSNHRNPLS